MTINEIVHPTVLIGAYAIFWFLCFFCLLPIGLGDVDPETGAPRAPHLKWKVLCATVIATLLFGAFYGMIRAGWLDL
jgi:predicted secreted protein